MEAYREQERSGNAISTEISTVTGNKPQTDLY
jgi:hypothetical protein